MTSIFSSDRDYASAWIATMAESHYKRAPTLRESTSYFLRPLPLKSAVQT
jgi:hypothetical protein